MWLSGSESKSQIPDEIIMMAGVSLNANGVQRKHGIYHQVNAETALTVLTMMLLLSS
jgi:hypothetical protein